MASLQGYVDHRVLLILQDGRAIVGVMAGFDQKSNVVLSDSKERVYSTDEGVEEIPLGLYLVKGDQMCVLPPFLLCFLLLTVLSFIKCSHRRAGRGTRPIRRSIHRPRRTSPTDPVLRNPRNLRKPSPPLYVLRHSFALCASQYSVGPFSTPSLICIAPLHYPPSGEEDLTIYFWYLLLLAREYRKL
ncbi:unnamed protein product [Somion occarium]|uniref:LSM2-LSM8 complex subunit LSM8 n=1 Tax=Somion occarium TaxID=3059160 RepID=A0ABP1CUR4_9APHY